jgi:HEAT repeat protein
MDPRTAALVEKFASGTAAAEDYAALGPADFHALAGSLPEHEAVRAALFSLYTPEDAPPPPPPALRELVRFAQAGWRTFDDPARASIVHDAMLALGDPLREMAPALLAELRDPDPFVHGAAARDLETLTHYLGSVGPDDGSLGEALRGALRDDCAVVRAWAAGALANLQEEADACVPAIAALLADPSRLVRAAAAEGLGAFGEEAQEAVPALARLLRETDTTVAFRAATALTRIGGSTAEVLNGLLHLARRPETDARYHGLTALASLPAPTREVVDALKAASEKDPEPSIREAAGNALRYLLQRHGSL